MTCINCRKKTEREVCPNCWLYAFEQLPKFPQYYRALETALIPSRAVGGERVSGSKNPPLPVHLESLHLRSGGISKVLEKHESEIRKIRQETVITFRGEDENRIYISSVYLAKRQEWIWDNYADYPQLVKDVISISQQVHHILGWKSEEVVIGTCPNIDTEGKECGSPLKVNPKNFDHTTRIHCKVCDTFWDNSHWRLLGKLLND